MQLGGAAILLHYNLVLASHHLHVNHAQICRLLFSDWEVQLLRVSI